MKTWRIFCVLALCVVTITGVWFCGGGGGGGVDFSQIDFGDPATHQLVFVSSYYGDDSTGDGSREKPFQTIDYTLTRVASLPARINFGEGYYYTNGITLNTDISFYGGYQGEFVMARDPIAFPTYLRTYCNSGTCAAITTSGLTNSTVIDYLNIESYSTPTDWLAISNINSSPTISNTTIFFGGWAVGESYGIKNISSSSPVITDNTIDAGSSSDSHGISNTNSSPVVSNNTIDGGSSGNSFGMKNISSSSPVITGNTIDGGRGINSYGIYNDDSTPDITNNTIDGGTGQYSYGINNWYSSPGISDNIIGGGSGLDSYGIKSIASSPVIENNTIDGAGSGTHSYGISNELASPVIRNNTISGGKGSTVSYGIYNTNNTSPFILNNTVYGGTSTYSYGIYIFLNSIPSIVNNIIMADYYGVYEISSDPVNLNNNNFFMLGGGTVLYRDADLALGLTDICDGAGNLSISGTPGNSDCSSELITPLGSGNVNTNPVFVDIDGADNDITTMNDNDWHLTASSPVVITDGANSAACPATDKDVVARTVPCSIGAYEYDTP